MLFILIASFRPNIKLRDEFRELLLSKHLSRLGTTLSVGGADREIVIRAIARVHRIGQHNPTTVWMYTVENTVEQSIYDISVTRRLAHIGRSSGRVERSDDASLENKLHAANTMELEETPLSNLLAKGSSGGEVVRKEDLWKCLFTRHSRDAEREVVRRFGEDAVEARQDLGGGANGV